MPAPVLHELHGALRGLVWVKGGHRVYPLSMFVVPQDSCRSCCVAETFRKVPATELTAAHSSVVAVLLGHRLTAPRESSSLDHRLRRVPSAVSAVPSGR
jgi:hypothetical protein